MKRIEPSTTIAQLDLSKSQRQQLTDLVELASKAKAGTSALLSGPRATNEAAIEAFAAELGRHMYRIDLSGVVGNYVGETEKNLGRVFDEAEGGAVLFFDDGDALFDERTETKDSHDRYANVRYLVDRIHRREGLSVVVVDSGDAPTRLLAWFDYVITLEPDDDNPS